MTTSLPLSAPDQPPPPCAADPEAFYPNAHAERAIRAARAVCLTACPYTDACLQWALDAGDDEGIFGGTTPHERRLMRTRRVVA